MPHISKRCGVFFSTAIPTTDVVLSVEREAGSRKTKPWILIELPFEIFVTSSRSFQ